MTKDEDLTVEQARRAEAEAEAAAEAEAERVRQHIEDATADPAVQTEWIRQANLMYGGLVAAGLVMVQPFLTETALDLSALICVIAFAVAIPLLAALLVLNRQEEFRSRATRSRPVATAKAMAQGAAFVGLTAGFWHMSLIAGIVFLATAVVAVGVHSSGYVNLEYDSRFRSRFRRSTSDRTAKPK
ncbi:hypothetical protein GCM10009745_48380 [Kribbella yunnanensis]|uniref:Uncharacterized protein n=1 Tax=Kribbella yunnanensis TaxID=190194 RepID=A0ABP4U3V6_9ACTN